MFFLKKIRTILTKHALVLVCALGVGAISVAPYLLAQRALGNEYRGVHYVFMDDEPGYMARVREVVEGHGWLGSPFLYEYKDAKPIIPPFGEYWYAALNILTQTSLSATLLLAKFLFPSVLFLLIYFFVYQFGDRSSLWVDKLAPLLAAFLVTLGYDLVDVRSVLHWLQGSPGFHAIVWTRPVNPVTGALLVFTFLLLLKKILDKNAVNTKYLFVICGLAITLSIGYFFAWGMILALVGVIFFGTLLRREYHLSKKIILIGVIAFLMSLPILLRVFTSLHSAQGALLSQRNGLFYSHAPIVNWLVLAVTIVFILVSLVRYLKQGKKVLLEDDAWNWSVYMLGASWLVFNQQIITGRVVWYPHFVQYTIPLMMVIMTLLGERLLKLWRIQVWYAVSLLGIMCSLAYGLAATTTYRSNLAEFKEIQKYRVVFDWLNTHAPDPCVVLPLEPNKQYSLMIRAFTRCNLYVANTERFYAVPDDRQKHNFFLLMRLRGVRSEGIETYLDQHDGEVINYFFENWDELFSSRLSSRLIEVRKQLPNEYRDFLKNNFSDEVYKYKVNYLVSENELSSVVMESLPKLKLIGAFEGLFLYEL